VIGLDIFPSEQFDRLPERVSGILQKVKMNMRWLTQERSP
jgi:hypothetical protein